MDCNRIRLALKGFIHIQSTCVALNVVCVCDLIRACCFLQR